MSSCRGRAEAFARRLSSKLRTFGAQPEKDTSYKEDAHKGTESVNESWIASNNDSDSSETDIVPQENQESDDILKFDDDLESPSSPIDECEYLQLIETTSNAPHSSAEELENTCASTEIIDESCTNEGVQTEDLKYLNEICQSRDSPDRKVFAFTQTYNKNQSIQIAFNSNTTENDSYNLLENFDLCKEKDLKKTDNLLIDLEDNDKENQKKGANSEYFTESLIKLENKNLNSCEENSDIAPVSNNAIDDENSLIQTTSSLSSRKNNSSSEPKVIILKDDLFANTNCTDEFSHESKRSRKENEKADSEDFRSLNTERGEVSASSIDSISQAFTSISDTYDDEECRPLVRRCTSLKTGKTPPGTPGRKKIVRFADVMGLDLADIKTFLDEIPTIPKSAFEDLEILDSEPPIQLCAKQEKMLMPLFQQPGGLPTFLDLVREKQVSLENATVTDPINHTISGSVRVRNLDFHKSVHIRYTLDSWRSFADLQANYVENSCDGFSDKFTFFLFGNSLQIGQRLEFAVRFQCKGQQFWDNNYGTNYCFQCLPTSSQVSNQTQVIVPPRHENSLIELLSPTAGDTWCSSFY